MKLFDEWGVEKKITDNRPVVVGVHDREIWWVALGVNVGVEIDGKHTTFERPGIVLRKFNTEMVWVLPVTSQQKNDSPFYSEFTIGDKKYFAALTQLRTVSTKRFLRKIGMIPKEDFLKMQARIMSFVVNERSPAQGGASRRPKP